MTSSEFKISDNAPQNLQDLYEEAAACLQHGFFTGASACLLLLNTELAELMEIFGENREERIHALRDNTNAESQLFDSLLSLKRYDNEETESLSYDGWSNNQLRQMLKIYSEIIEEYYPNSV